MSKLANVRIPLFDELGKKHFTIKRKSNRIETHKKETKMKKWFSLGLVLLVCQPVFASPQFEEVHVTDIPKLEIKHKSPKPIKPLQAPKAMVVVKHTPPKVTTAPRASGSLGWHRDCRSQRESVRASVSRLGLGGSWTYIDYIFAHESCHDPGRLNGSGCRGLGQACPGSKLPCTPTQIDCQVRFFDGYAKNRYGSWSNAYSAWKSKGWW